MYSITVDSAVLMPYKVRSLGNFNEGNDKHDTGGSPISLGSLSPCSCQMSDVFSHDFWKTKNKQWIMRVTVTRVCWKSCYQGEREGEGFFHYEKRSRLSSNVTFLKTVKTIMEAHSLSGDCFTKKNTRLNECYLSEIRSYKKRSAASSSKSIWSKIFFAAWWSTGVIHKDYFKKLRLLFHSPHPTLVQKQY